MKHKFLLLYCWFIRTIMFFLPDIPFIMRFRGFMYGLGMKKCGKNFQLAHDSNIKGLENLIVGTNCYIANGCIIINGGVIVFDDDVQLGPHVVLVSNNHTAVNNSFRYGKSVCGSIHIGKGCWIGSNCTVLMNSTLPNGSILGANSVLNKSYIMKNSLYAGSPAKLIKSL